MLWLARLLSVYFSHSGLCFHCVFLAGFCTTWLTLCVALGATVRVSVLRLSIVPRGGFSSAVRFSARAEKPTPSQPVALARR
jgi:hypothetical protein